MEASAANDRFHGFTCKQRPWTVQLAGLSAAATYSALAEPTVPVVALDRVKAKSLLDARGIQELPTADEAELEVEVWSYKPGMLSEGPAVDRLSLYLSLRDDTDERVHSALDEMMRGVTW